MDGHIGETRQVIASGKFENDKRYKEKIVREVINAICAMLNSNGGKVAIDIDTGNNNIAVETTSFSQISMLIRMLEQSMISIIGLHKTTSYINFHEDEETVIIFVQKSVSLITSAYNLCLPSQTQVVHVPSVEPLKNVEDDIMNRKIVPEPVEVGTHFQIFRKDTICSIRESKTVQLKNLEAHATKRTTLADRIISKRNKLTCYVSGFSNFNGGHIYYGIDDNRLVVGEWIASEEDRSEIIKKVEKAIKKMIWPEHIGQPKRGEHWDIFFEPVLDEGNKPIPSTFVIVVYIAPCLGGVFTEEPECYEMVEGKITKMSFITWKERILQPNALSYVDDISFRFKRVTWSSTKIRDICVFANDLLIQCVNNGKSIETISTNLEQTFSDHKIELKLLVLSKKVISSYRSNCFNMANDLLEEYNGLLTATTEFELFDTIGVYLQTALYRAQGDFASLREILPAALAKAERIEPTITSAAIYLLAAAVKTLFQTKDVGKLRVETNPVFSIRALEHLQHVTDCPVVKTDMERKSHIASALFFLGGDISGKLTRKDIDSESLEKANSSITAVQSSIDEGKPISIYRTVQLNIVNSVLYYRYSQVQLDRKELLLEKAFDFSKKAKSIATKFKFVEMLEWARACMALCTEGLVRTHFKTSTSRNF